MAGWYPDPAGGIGQRWHDGQGWTGPTSHARPRKALGASFARLGDSLARLLLVHCFVRVAALLVILWSFTDPGVLVRANVRAEAQVAAGTMPTYVVVMLLLIAGYLILCCVTGVLWLVWQHRLAVSAPGALRSSPAMHVVWWIIPFASYVLPVRNISDLWRSYAANQRTNGPGAEPVAGPPIFGWWTCWILSALFVGFTYMALVGDATLMDSQNLAVLGAVGALLEALAAGLAALVVRQLSWMALLATPTRPEIAWIRPVGGVIPVFLLNRCG